MRQALLLLLLPQLLLQLQLLKAEETPQGHLEEFGKQGPNLGIDQVDGFIPPQEFINEYVRKNKPLLFKGAAKLSPAFNKWTDEYLSSMVPPRPAGDIFIEHSKKENRSQGYNFVHFKKFLEIYNTSNIYMVSDVPEYLLSDLLLPFPLQCRLFIRGGLDTHVVWFSSGGTSSVIHHDAYENINCLYRGRKKLVFLNTTKYPEQAEKIIDREEGSFSSVDVDKVDVTKRPEFSGLEFHIAEMETGDCLYIPLFWIHQVRSFENNLAVNIWWPPRTEYKLGECMPQYSTKLNFNRVYFKTIENNIRGDVDNIRLVLKAILPKDDRTEASLMKILSGGNEALVANPEFASAVSSIFKALDLNMDGELSDEELGRKLTRKDFRPIYKAVAAYNIIVYRMHETAGNGPEADRLPKLFRTSNSDESVFAPHRTWTQPEPPGPEEEEDEMPTDDWQPPQAEPEKSKDEL
ncbi:hypothetical protein BOX15_Mlig029500g1 [Macrostomum lignano]|uniref:JmjC domain-containing protein n=1 Tax=Macrostomum lignano TaxID=282301 RepID=A0A267FL02_9PLAT|nr:hypothetical protein BOX15_Mlig029500g3 [Macrostomum lignano]PAA77793.1 hypothetical protein BOX15_Mlig029500g1 [Macrostomum lignano]